MIDRCTSFLLGYSSNLKGKLLDLPLDDRHAQLDHIDELEMMLDLKKRFETLMGT